MPHRWSLDYFLETNHIDRPRRSVEEEDLPTTTDGSFVTNEAKKTPARREFESRPSSMLRRPEKG